MKKVTLCYFALVVALFCVSLLSSCSKGTDPDVPVVPTVILREETTNIPPESSAVIRSYDTSGTIVMEDSSNYAQNIDVGDVIIGQDDIKAPYGFLRKVTSKTTQADTTMFETEQATIFDAFEELNISETHKLSPSDVKSYKLHKGALFKGGSDNDTFVVALDCIFYDQDGNFNTTGDQIKISGRYAFTADLFVVIETEGLSLRRFETGIQTSQVVDLDLIASLQWEFDKAVEFDLAEFHLGAIPVGGFVWLVPTLTVEAHIHGDLTVTFETGITYTQQLRFGFGWTNNQFYDIREGTRNFTYSPPQLTVEFNFEPGVSLNASCLLYGVAGPYVAGKAGFHFQSVLSADPCDIELTFDLEAILYAVVGIECDILGLDYNKEFQLYTHAIGEWIYPLSDSGTIVIDSEPNSLNAPWSIVGPCSYSTSGTGDKTLTELATGDYTMTWGAVSGWIKPSNSTQTLAANETVTFSGTYVEEAVTGIIVIDPSPDILNAPWSLAGPNSYSTSGTGDKTLMELATGDYTVIWGAVSGWIKPSNATQTLAANQTVTFSGTYVEEVGPDSTGTVTDMDGNVYKTIKIGNQWWMAENLKVTHYRNGDPIPNVTDHWGGLYTGAYCNYNNNEGNVATYGRLYNWHVVGDSRNIAPAGWHVPSDAEWQILVDYLGGSAIAGGKMKETGTTHWNSPNTGATNESGFTALPGGYRANYGDFYYMGYYAKFWSSTECGSRHACFRYLYYGISDVSRESYYEDWGFSVRCVRD